MTFGFVDRRSIRLSYGPRRAIVERLGVTVRAGQASVSSTASARADRRARADEATAKDVLALPDGGHCEGEAAGELLAGPAPIVVALPAAAAKEPTESRRSSYRARTGVAAGRPARLTRAVPSGEAPLPRLGPLDLLHLAGERQVVEVGERELQAPGGGRRVEVLGADTSPMISNAVRGSPASAAADPARVRRRPRRGWRRPSPACRETAARGRRGRASCARACRPRRGRR